MTWLTCMPTSEAITSIWKRPHDQANSNPEDRLSCLEQSGSVWLKMCNVEETRRSTTDADFETLDCGVVNPETLSHCYPIMESVRRHTSKEMSSTPAR